MVLAQGVLPAPQGVRVLLSYQPADRFPLFQGIETTIFVIAAIALLGLAVWLVRRRA
jgi:LPXTG-motif cell wall-anchored protein